MKNCTLTYFFSFSLLILATISQTASAHPFVGGDGTVGEPYQIENCIQLQEARNYVTSNFVLTRDINCYETNTWNSGAGFIPIGTFATPFFGIFDGQGHVISGVYMSGAGTGVFDEVTGTIRNLGLIDVTVNAPSYAYIGALVGTLNGGTLSQVFAKGEVTGVSYVGGLVGWHISGPITNAYAHVKSSGTYSGGLVGRNDASVITNTYANGNGFTTAQYGLIGNNFGGSSVNSFYDSQVMGRNDTNGGSTPKTTAQMKSVTTYTATSTPGLTTAWDFVGTQNNDLGVSDIWNIDPVINGGYPYFTWQTFDQTAPTITSIGVSVPDGRYGPGAVIPVVIAFSEPVISSGPVTVTFETGAIDRTCTFTINHATVGACSFTVDTSDVSGDLDATISGSIADVRGNALVNFTPTLGLAAQRSLVINPVTVGGTQGGGSVAEQVEYLSANGNAPMAEQIKSEWPQVFGSTAVATQQKIPLVFARDLKVGMTDPDVKKLQEYLNSHGFVVAVSGPGSKGKEIEYFGVATKRAVIKFQKTNRIPQTGNVGPLTRKLLK